MSYRIQVSRAGNLLFEAGVTEMYAKMIGAICTFGIQRLSCRPQDTGVILACLVRTIDEALQSNTLCHKKWLGLVADPSNQPIELDLVGIKVQSEELSFGRGGEGGGGSWPGGNALNFSL